MSYIHNQKCYSNDCACHILNDPKIYISKDIFHNNICNIHSKYLKSHSKDKILYEETGRDYLIDIIEYNIFKQQIRDATICYLAEYIQKFF